MIGPIGRQATIGPGTFRRRRMTCDEVIVLRRDACVNGSHKSQHVAHHAGAGRPPAGGRKRRGGVEERRIGWWGADVHSSRDDEARQSAERRRRVGMHEQLSL